LEILAIIGNQNRKAGNNMAYLHQAWCNDCGKETRHMNHKCQVCGPAKERARIAAWNEQTTQVKLNDLRKRVEKLEQGPATY